MMINAYFKPCLNIFKIWEHAYRIPALFLVFTLWRWEDGMLYFGKFSLDSHDLNSENYP